MSSGDEAAADVASKASKDALSAALTIREGKDLFRRRANERDPNDVGDNGVIGSLLERNDATDALEATPLTTFGVSGSEHGSL